MFQKYVAVLVVGRNDCICVGDLDVNAELVRLGTAWVYDKYATVESLYVLQQEAVNEGRGM